MLAATRLVLLVHAVLCGLTGATAAEKNATGYYLSEYPLATCLDGSPAAYFLRAGAESTKYLLFHEGGGFCSSVDDCSTRSTTSLGSSAAYPHGSVHATDVAFGGTYGVTAPHFTSNPSTNPLFHNWTHVYVRYCDGGAYAGDRIEPVPIPGTTRTLAFRGRYITESLVADLESHHGLRAATDVVVGGCSAGGFHVHAHLDHVRSLLPTTAQVVGYSDSGWPMVSATGQPTNTVRDRFLTSATGHNGTLMLSPACFASEAEPSRCVTPASLARYGLTPIFLFQSEFDLANLRDPAVADPSCEASALCVNAFGANMSKMIASTLLSSAAGSQYNAVFLDSCARHCQFGVHPRWMAPIVEGLNPMQALNQWHARLSPPRVTQRTWAQAQEYPCVHCCNASTITRLVV